MYMYYVRVWRRLRFRHVELRHVAPFVGNSGCVGWRVRVRIGQERIATSIQRHCCMLNFGIITWPMGGTAMHGSFVSSMVMSLQCNSWFMDLVPPEVQGLSL